MKPAMLIPFFLVVAAVAPAAVCAQPAVLDTVGNPVLPDVEYYINAGGRVSHSERFLNLECPQIVVLTSPFSQQAGIPVKFFPHGSINYLPESIKVSIRFSATSWPCEDDTKLWRVDPNSPTVVPDISTDGFLGDEDSTFSIEQLGPAGYKIVHCTKAFPRCSAIGVLTDPDGKEHLGPSPAPLIFTFTVANPPN